MTFDIVCIEMKKERKEASPPVILANYLRRGLESPG
jgi:hypothetical protein